jgi:hypothetical protein
MPTPGLHRAGVMATCPSILVMLGLNIAVLLAVMPGG